MEDVRTKGFVVGFDQGTQGQRICKVRVKDNTSTFNDRKLVVASIRGGIELAQGLNVNFLIGTVDGPNGEKALRAVDVSLELPDVGGTKNPVSRSGG